MSDLALGHKLEGYPPSYNIASEVSGFIKYPLSLISLLL